MTDDIVTRLLDFTPLSESDLAILLLDAAREIEHLRAENKAIMTANHDSIWKDILIPIADACGVSLYNGQMIPRRQYQMVEQIIKAVSSE